MSQFSEKVMSESFSSDMTSKDQSSNEISKDESSNEISKDESSNEISKDESSNATSKDQSSNALLSEKDIVHVTSPAGTASKFAILFSWANSFDYFLIGTGLVCGLVAGLSVSLMNYLLGDIINLFIDFLIAKNVDPSSVLLQEKLFWTEMTYSLTFLSILGVVIFQTGYWMLALLNWSAARQCYRLKTTLFASLLEKEISFFDGNSTGELINRSAADIFLVQEGLSGKMGLTALYAATFISCFSVAFFRCWQLTLVVCMIFPIISASNALFSRVSSRFSEKAQPRYARASAYAGEVIAGIRTVVSFGAQSSECENYSDLAQEAAKKNEPSFLISGASMGIICMLAFFSYSLAFWSGAKLIESGVILKRGVILSVFFCVISGAVSVRHIFQNFEIVSRGILAASTLSNIIKKDEDQSLNISKKGVDDEEHLRVRGLIEKGGITLENVSFRYNSPSDAGSEISNISLVLEPGKKTALVGKSGSGKSTIVDLLQRFYRPQSGRILIGDEEDHNISPLAMRSSIGIVSQEPILFDESVFINVALGAINRASVTMEDVANACRIANAHTFILGLPQGYSTRVGPGGSMLSDGQRQRIAIARSLMRDPSLLILDEATSSLNSASEAAVQDALEMASKGRTTLVIAHKLSSVISADKIILLQEGKILQQGSHSELISHTEGPYFELVHPQKGDTAVFLDNDSTPVDDRYLETPDTCDGIDYDAIAASPSILRLSDTARGRKCTLPLSKIVHRILRMQGPEYAFMLFGLLCAIVNGSTMPILSFLFADLQSVFAEPSIAVLIKGVKFYCFWFFIQGLISGVSQLGQTAFFGIAGERLASRLRASCFKSLVSMDQNHPLKMAYFDTPQNAPSRLIARLSSEVDSLKKLTGPLFGTLIQALVTVGLGLFVAFYSGYKLAIILVLCMPLMAIASFFERNTRTYFGSNIERSSELAQARMGEALHYRRTVSGLCRESWFLEQYCKQLDAPHRLSVISAFVGAIGFGLSQAMLCWIYAISFYFGAKLVLSGELDYAAMNRVLYSIIFCAMAAGKTIACLPDVPSGRLAAQSIFELLSYGDGGNANASLDEYRKDQAIASNVPPQIRLENVRFSYPSRPETRVLDDLNLTFEAGKRIAIVGPSGSGKSSIFGLFERFYEPQTGSILFDGKDISTIPLSVVRETFGLASKEPVLFSRSIWENICLGRQLLKEKEEEEAPSIPQVDVENASILAGIHSDIISLSCGYETQLGEFGSQLSGDQKQRIAIARVLLKNPPILLFDEATCALDAQSEEKIQAALMKDFASSERPRTFIVIAHRLSTIRDFDLIYVMDKGKVVEMGDHSSLLSKRGLYYKLYKKESRQAHEDKGVN
ncbi:hypothetical protein MDAP_002230 [Mitosporidium daphniae]